jgi:hypothetical protein
MVFFDPDFVENRAYGYFKTIILFELLVRIHIKVQLAEGLREEYVLK